MADQFPILDTQK